MLTKTPKGTDVLNTRSIALPTKQRTLLLLANGSRTDQELLSQTQGMATTQFDLDALIAIGLLEQLPPAGYVNSIATIQPAAAAPVNNELTDLRNAAFQVRDASAAPSTLPRTSNTQPLSNLNNPQSAPSSVQMSTQMPSLDANTRPMTEAERFELAYRMATKLSAELGLRAFRLQLSLERASTIEEIRDLRPKLLEALIKESGEPEAQRRIRPLDKLMR
jgi:hypothetical protein